MNWPDASSIGAIPALFWHIMAYFHAIHMYFLTTPLCSHEIFMCSHRANSDPVLAYNHMHTGHTHAIFPHCSVMLSWCLHVQPWLAKVLCNQFYFSRDSPKPAFPCSPPHSLCCDREVNSPHLVASHLLVSPGSLMLAPCVRQQTAMGQWSQPEDSELVSGVLTTQDKVDGTTVCVVGTTVYVVYVDSLLSGV